ncbi:hypothetical protein PR003_g23928 [Phytophthora rubi]|uniref:Prokaryotic-type class I peptide chain release factors domain-containing protein n=1 Tax=Phytophthora rubi TaxID=129364 RepID=A0A6A3ILE0_9STRA|nr:hypothetical protein PR002_g23154 [Phytophthora rubi]KAE8990158.1 hypothetical protein PR001_g21572 [Phytophthora rubi]KAE9295751.1 hypothetical protein PR003_g23928 [Phytophthora rubi]
MGPTRRSNRQLTSPVTHPASPHAGVHAANALLWTRPFSSSDGPVKPDQRTEVLLREADLTESFVKGSGKGGQKINKVRNCVLLTHVPTGLQVQCQKTRSLGGNRRAARKLLLQKLDDQVNGALSKRSEKIERLRRKKASRRAKAKHKYANSGVALYPPAHIEGKLLKATGMYQLFGTDTNRRVESTPWTRVTVMSLARLLSTLTLRPAANDAAHRYAGVHAANALLWTRPFSSSDGPVKPDQRTEVLLREADLTESFVKGSGKGGQKINKVRNCVLLTHVPTGLQVQCQKTRSLGGNRRVARKLLLQKLDDQVNGALSKRSEKIERLRRKKASRRAKAKHKYANSGVEQDSDDNGEEEDDDEDDDDDEEDDDDVIDLEEHRFKAKKKKKSK